ncbi:RusA family crossover junction endodeoxyribonuclease [Cronbergia sp. UHCC 0137]|uniref:RusA family crossover junction endodeoxyribonuclease n=1 Tax=Cronbergia sp. UHCC 0137 TaxID=3110239 RepID=UPI002B21C0A4|nr:RusA family crossover junction endodeoxyribonuclease [Cronbergia sp. UHCC 0137]MEA5618420.1 RusA family crossover junction endodeoxyribonuclease [Cronbergia sp. UHCC 0137]
MLIIPFEFLILKRPVSLQGKNKNLQEWKRLVHSEAQKVWNAGSPIKEGDLQLTIVYICASDPPDTDNIIKPIQDALNKLVYEDDRLVSDVESHRRFPSEIIDITDLPSLLQDGMLTGKECVYVKVSSSKPLEKYL